MRIVNTKLGLYDWRVIRLDAQGESAFLRPTLTWPEIAIVQNRMGNDDHELPDELAHTFPISRVIVLHPLVARLPDTVALETLGVALAHAILWSINDEYSFNHGDASLLAGFITDHTLALRARLWPASDSTVSDMLADVESQT